MSGYVALVRGINVGGRNAVPMPALRAMFESLGHERVTTYIQSGNVCFTTAENRATASASGDAAVQAPHPGDAPDQAIASAPGDAAVQAVAPGLVELAAEIERGILHTFGLGVHVVLRTKTELARLADLNPFLDIEADHAKVHVFFLAATPTPEGIAKLDPDRFPPDEFAVVGREIFVRYPDGAGRSRLTLDYFERRLGTHGTARNWNTVNELLARLDT